VSRHSFPVFILYSLLIHLVVMSFFAAGWIRPATHKPSFPEPTTLTLVATRPPTEPTPPPQPKLTPRPDFVPTLEAQKVDKANPNAPLESDRNTRLASKSTDLRAPNSPLPEIRGDPRIGLSYANILGNTPREDVDITPPKPTPPPDKAPDPDPAPPTPTPPPPAVAQTTPTPPPQQHRTSLQPPDPRLQPRQDPPRVAQNQQQQPQDQSPQSPRPPPPQPQTFSLSKSRSDIRGGGAPGHLPSPEARETELGRYKAKIYRAIGSRWYLNVEIAKADLAIGVIKIRFYVQANGVVRNVEVVEDTGGQMLRTISVRAIVDSAPFEPFSDSMKAQLGDGYAEEFTFTIY
jgi:outer membrane biosynthesis protein TonB